MLKQGPGGGTSIYLVMPVYDRLVREEKFLNWECTFARLSLKQGMFVEIPA